MAQSGKKRQLELSAHTLDHRESGASGTFIFTRTRGMTAPVVRSVRWIVRMPTLGGRSTRSSAFGWSTVSSTIAVGGGLNLGYSICAFLEKTEYFLPRGRGRK
jgi:hypothetical protein